MNFDMKQNVNLSWGDTSTWKPLRVESTQGMNTYKRLSDGKTANLKELTSAELKQVHNLAEWIWHALVMELFRANPKHIR